MLLGFRELFSLLVRNGSVKAGLFVLGLHGRAWLSSVPLPETGTWLLLVGVRVRGAH